MQMRSGTPLQPHIADVTGDICATALRIEPESQTDLIKRLKQDLEKFAGLIKRASEFVAVYGEKGKVVRWLARNQLGGDMDKINKELDQFGTRFRDHRLVDLALNQNANTQALAEIHATVVSCISLSILPIVPADRKFSAVEKLEKWLEAPPTMSRKQHDTESLRKEGTGRWFLEGDKFIEWQDHAGTLWIEGPSGAGKSVLSNRIHGLVEIIALIKCIEDDISTAELS
ncbi:hypothetical protein B0H14DRAFT_3872712 [Mycena olivaceomarginata]|nr:hypothetical protein B0H14DRAFT_3872712 [Mycena olivaceomarginata]